MAISGHQDELMWFSGLLLSNHLGSSPPPKKARVFFLLSKRSFGTACMFGMLYFKLEPDSIFCVPVCDTQI